MNTVATFATLAPLPNPSGGAFPLAPNGNRERQVIQTYLYQTQFYKGRQDGLPDDERMDAAIKLVQIAAHLPVTGVFGDAERDAIDRYRSELQSFLPYADAFAQGALKDKTQIEWAQRALAALGHYPKTGPFDGDASLALVKAFKAFVAANPKLLPDDSKYGRWLPTEQTVTAVRSALTAKGLSPDAPNVPVAVPGPMPVKGAPPTQHAFARDFLTFAVLTSPAWGYYLFKTKPWTKLGALRNAPARGRGRTR